MPKTTLKVPLIGTPKVRPRPTRCRANGADCSNLTHPLFLPLFLGRMRESQHAASNGDWRNMVSILNGRVTRVIFIFLASEIHTFSNVTNGHRHRLDIAIPSDPPPPLLERTRLKDAPATPGLSPGPFSYPATRRDFALAMHRDPLNT